MRSLNFLEHLFVFILIVFLVLLNSCSDDPFNLQNNLYNPEFGGEVRDTVLYAVKDTTYLIQPIVGNRLTNNLVIGSYKGFESRIILKFSRGLPPMAKIIAARIQFRADGYVGDMNAQPFIANAYPILKQWVSNKDSIWEDYTQNFDPTVPLGQIEFAPSEDDTFFLQMNTNGLEKFTFWADTNNADQNFGLILDFAEATYLQYLTSINIEGDPTIVVEPMLIFDYQSPEDTLVKTDTISATFDAYVYSVNIPMLESRNYVSTQKIYNTLIQFDFESLLEKFPEGIDVVSANLQIPIDKESSFFNPKELKDLQVQRTLTDFNTSKVVVDSSFQGLVFLSQWSSDSSYVEVFAGDERRKFARSVIQLQLMSLKSSSALMIEFESKTAPYSYVALYKSGLNDKELLPKLYLTFRVPPVPRF